MNGRKLKFELDSKMCKACGICVAFCPKKVLERDEEGKPYAANDSSCIFCKLCEMRCPDFAIRIGEESHE